MTTNAERISKLATKLATVEAQKTKYDTLYTEITNEITSILTTEVVTATKTAMAKSAPKMKSGELSNKVLSFITKSPGQNLHEIANKLHVEAKRIGVALYHLTKKEQAFFQEGRYFAEPGLALAAKSAPASAVDED